jgi:hypothetical protein
MLGFVYAKIADKIENIIAIIAMIYLYFIMVLNKSFKSISSLDI